MTLGQRIQELRKQAGLSQEGLGEALGVSRQAVSKWESDGGIPELDTLIAMSKLFRISIGELLGVEQPEEKEQQDQTGLNEEQVEAILRRYVEESRRPAEPEPPQKYPIGSWIIAAFAVVLTVVMLVVGIGRVRGVRYTISDLRSQISVLQSELASMRYQVGGLSDELRGVLEEQNSLISSFDYEVVSFDVEKETVELKLSATLKEYTPGSRVQFALNWIKADQTTGEMTCNPVEGPEFEIKVTVPMNFHMEIDVLILREDGTIHEQPTDIIYSGMHPGEFSVKSYSRGTWCSHAEGRVGYQVDLNSNWPEEIYPVSAEIVVVLNGREVYREEAPIRDPEETPLGPGEYGEYQVMGTIQLEPFRKNDDLQLWCYVTDNFGRVEEIQLPVGEDGTFEVESPRG